MFSPVKPLSPEIQTNASLRSESDIYSSVRISREAGSVVKRVL
jgi:hypothetical protein